MKTIRRLLQFPSTRDSWLAFACIMAGSLLCSLLLTFRLYQPVILALTPLIIGALYVGVRPYLLSPAGEYSNSTAGMHDRRIHLGLVVLVVGLCLLCYPPSAQSLGRPAWVFAVMAIIPAVIAVQTIATADTRMKEAALLIELIALTATLTLTSVTVFPNNGGDTWAYLFSAQEILSSGSVDQMTGSYRDYPLYPALLAGLAALGGMQLQEAARILNVLIAVSTVLLIFCCVASIGNLQSAVWAALIVIGSKWFIYWSTLVVSMTLNLVFFSGVMVILFRRMLHAEDTSSRLAMIVVLGIVPFFHPVGAIAAILLLSMFALLEFYYRKQIQSHYSLLIPVILVLVVTVAQWVYFSDFFLDRTVRSLVFAIFGESETPLRLADSYRDPWIFTLDQLNFCMLVVLAGIGVLWRVRADERPLELTAGIIGFGFTGFGYVTQAVSLQEVLPHRWFLFGSLLLTIPAAMAVTRLSARRLTPVALALPALLVAIYGWTGMVNTEVNRDRPFYGESQTALVELTNAEFAGVQQMRRLVEQRDVAARVDFRLWDYLKFVTPEANLGYWKTFRLEDFQGVFVVREAYWTRWLLMGETAGRVDLEAPGMSRFYDNGDLTIFERTAENP